MNFLSSISKENPMNMEEKLTKELAEKIIKIQGEIRGVGLKQDWSVVLQWEGQEGLKKLERKMEELGYPLRYSEIRTMDFYPMGLDTISLLAIKELFNYDNEKFRELGMLTMSFSVILKVFLKYFISLKKVSEQIPRIWREYYTIGELKVIETNEQKKLAILRLEDFNIHPIYCHILKGFFVKGLKIVVGKPVTCEERKCSYRGDEYHEFLLTWE